MRQYEIKHRHTGTVLYAGGEESLREVAEQAVRSGANLAGANLAGAYLAGADLSRANLAGAYLGGANLAGAYLAGADLSRANLARAYLGGAYLARANLAGADLGGANLAGANLARADLAGAYLAGAYLAGANLDGAYLGGADLAGAYLVYPDGPRLIGERPVLQVGPIGSRCAYLVSYLTDRGVYVRAGCWFGALDAFRVRVSEAHGGNEHGREYAAAIAMIEAHSSTWTPATDEVPA